MWILAIFSLWFNITLLAVVLKQRSTLRSKFWEYAREAARETPRPYAQEGSLLPGVLSPSDAALVELYEALIGQGFSKAEANTAARRAILALPASTFSDRFRLAVQR